MLHKIQDGCHVKSQTSSNCFCLLIQSCAYRFFLPLVLLPWVFLSLNFFLPFFHRRLSCLQVTSIRRFYSALKVYEFIDLQFIDILVLVRSIWCLLVSPFSFVIHKLYSYRLAYIKFTTSVINKRVPGWS